jgi:hypothetical protein
VQKKEAAMLIPKKNRREVYKYLFKGKRVTNLGQTTSTALWFWPP